MPNLIEEILFMGERLVFNMFRGHQPNITHICSIHFHWSAYTASVYHEAKMLIDGLKRHGYNINMSDHETIQLLIDTVQENVTVISQRVVPPRPGTGEEPTIIPERRYIGGITADDVEFAKMEGFKFTEDDVSHSNGIIAISNDAMNSFEEWAEDIEDFYIDDGCYTNSLFTTMPYNEFKNEYPGISVDNIPDYFVPNGCDPTFPTFWNTDELIAWIKDRQENSEGWVLGKYVVNDVLYFECIYTC